VAAAAAGAEAEEADRSFILISSILRTSDGGGGESVKIMELFIEKR
jgi:hypothetical protein